MERRYEVVVNGSVAIASISSSLSGPVISANTSSDNMQVPGIYSKLSKARESRKMSILGPELRWTPFQLNKLQGERMAPPLSRAFRLTSSDYEVESVP